MDPGALSRPGRVPKQSPESPLRWRWRCGTFRRFLIDYLGFWYREDLIGEGGKVGGQSGGPHHALARPGLACAKGECAQPLAPLRLSFWLRESSRKIVTLAFVLSNSENIHFLTSWNQKQQKTINWHCGSC